MRIAAIQLFLGRISTLHEQSDDDEQNTYNGNSTQQM